MSKADIENVKQAVLNGDYENVMNLCQAAIDSGEEPTHVLTGGLAEGMNELARKFGKKGMYLDTVLWSTAAFTFGSMALQEALSTAEHKPKGKVVIGVPDGPWTIGPSVVSAVLTAEGYEVHNAGSDVGPLAIARKAEEVGADFVATGLYLSYRINMLEELEQELSRMGIRQRVKTIISGPSTSQEIAKRIGADAYCANAAEIVDVLNRFRNERKREMTGRQRVLTALDLKEPDRVPLVPFAMTFCAKQYGIPFSEYVSNGKMLAEAEVSTARRFGWDAVIASCDTAVFAEVVGGKAVIPHDDVPRITEPAINAASAAADFKKLRDPSSYLKVGRLAEYLSSVTYMKNMVADELAIIGWTEGPFQGAMLLMNADPQAIFMMRQEKELLHEIMEWYSEYAFQCAKVFVDNGADIIGSGESAAYYLSPEAFEEFVLPHEKKLYSRINKDLGVKVLIHSCGYVPQCLKYAPLANPGGVIQFDYQVPLGWAKKLVGKEITLMGNLDCNRLLHLGTPQEVEEACRKAILMAGPGGGYLLSGGCEIPRDMPYENMQAMQRACVRYGTYPLKTKVRT
jgi:MtaA/CmuA family methyltransferase